MANQEDECFFDPDQDESEGPALPPAFAITEAGQPEPHLARQRDYLERLLKAWQQAHGHKKKKAA